MGDEAIACTGADALERSVNEELTGECSFSHEVHDVSFKDS